MIKRIRESDFIQNIIVLFSGSLLSQLIPFLVLPILQKYFYGPADFGLLAIFIAFCELFANMATFKLEYGIVIQKSTKNAINLAFGAFRIMLIVAVVSVLLSLIFRKQIVHYFGDSRLDGYVLLLPVYIVVFSLTEIGSYWFNRAKRFNTISVSKIFQTSTAESTKLAGGLFQLGPIGLIAGRITGFLAANLYYLNRFLKKDRGSLRLLNREYSKKMVWENRKFIFFTTPSVFVGNLINVAYLQLFLHFFGKELVGVLSVSMTYIAAGFGVVAISFSQVFYSKAAETTRREDLLHMYKRFVRNLFLISLVPVAVVYLTPASFIGDIVGKEWIRLIEVARIMVLWLAVWFVSSSLSFIYMRLKKQQIMLIYDIVHFFLILAGFFTGYYLRPDYEGALWGFTVAQIVFYLFVIYVAVYFIKKADEVI